MHRARNVWFWSVVVGLWFASAQTVGAQDEKTSPEANAGVEEQARPAGQLGIELGGYYRDDDAASRFELAPILNGWLSVADGIDMSLDWGVALLSISPDKGSSKSAFYLGNPTLSIKRVLCVDRNEIYFGVGVAVPVSSITDKPRDLDQGAVLNDWEKAYLRTRYAAMTGSAMRGLWDYWIWMPEHLSFLIPVGARMISKEHILLGGDAALAVLIPMGDYGSDRAELVLQFAGEVGFGFEKFSAGLRLQGVVLPIPGGDEPGHAQFSVGPFARVDVKHAFFTLKAMLNLDPPFGTFDDGRSVWGVMLGGGATF